MGQLPGPANGPDFHAYAPAVAAARHPPGGTAKARPMHLPIYVINLNRRPDRLADMTAHLNELGLSFERIAATDADTLPDDGAVNRPPFLDIGARACLMSHRRALLAFLESGREVALILEDDVRLASDVPALCESVEWWPPGASVLKLDAPDRRVRLQGWLCGQTPGGRDLRAIVHWNWGAGATLLNREAAIAVSDAYARQDMSTDHVMFDTLLSPLPARRLRPLQVIPAAAEHPEDHGSDLTQWRDTIPKRRRRRYFLRYRSSAWRLRVRWWRLTGRTCRIGIHYEDRGR